MKYIELTLQCLFFHFEVEVLKNLNKMDLDPVIIYYKDWNKF